MAFKSRTRKCIICRTPFQPRSMTHKACSPECAAAVAVKEREKKERQQARLEARRAAEERREHRAKVERLKTRQEWLKEAQSEFNRYIRERDKDLPCISCGQHRSSYDAGHFRSVGAAPQLRFDEDNCHKQCVHCNQHLSGNALEYRSRLIARIGIDRVSRLEDDNSVRKYTIEDAKSIKAHYRAKFKDLQKC